MPHGVRLDDRATWEARGGRVRFDAKGRPVYVIRKQIGGRRYEVSTRRHTLAAALGEWEKFERDPEGYSGAGDPGAVPLFLDNDLSEKFLRWSLREKQNTAEWVSKQRSALAWWMEKLGSADLRRLQIRDLSTALEGAPGKRHRIEVIRALYGWLRKQAGTITAHEDPTYGALPVPQAVPAQWTKARAFPREHYLLAREHLVGPYRDALDVLAGTGWHVTECMRFANSGAIEPLPRAMKVENGAAGVLICPRHKSGDTHRTAVGAEVLEAAQRLRDRGWPSDSKFPFYQAVESACVAAKIPPFSPGAFRHSVATWALERGSDPAAVAAFLGHRSPATTRRFYATLATVPKVPTLA